MRVRLTRGWPWPWLAALQGCVEFAPCVAESEYYARRGEARCAYAQACGYLVEGQSREECVVAYSVPLEGEERIVDVCGGVFNGCQAGRCILAYERAHASCGESEWDAVAAAECSDDKLFDGAEEECATSTD